MTLHPLRPYTIDNRPFQGHLTGQWTHWLGDLSTENQPNGEVVLSGAVADQGALYGILGRMRAGA